MADNLSHEYQLENLMIGERKVIKKNLSFANSFWIHMFSIKALHYPQILNMLSNELIRKP